MPPGLGSAWILVGFNLKKMQAYKDESVEEYRSMIRSLLNRRNVKLIHGTAKLHKDNIVEVEGEEAPPLCRKEYYIGYGSRAGNPGYTGSGFTPGDQQGYLKRR